MTDTDVHVAVVIARGWLADTVSPNGVDADMVAAALIHASARLAAAEHVVRMAREWDFAALHDSKAAWSLKTFGPGDRYAGVVAHIRKELIEIEAEPADLTEWCDVILLAMDGAMRSCGATGADLMAALRAKQARNETRTWPDWRSLKPGDVSEHIASLTDKPAKGG